MKVKSSSYNYANLSINAQMCQGKGFLNKSCKILNDI